MHRRSRALDIINDAEKRVVNIYDELENLQIQEPETPDLEDPTPFYKITEQLHVCYTILIENSVYIRNLCSSLIKSGGPGSVELESMRMSLFLLRDKLISCLTTFYDKLNHQASCNTEIDDGSLIDSDDESSSAMNICADSERQDNTKDNNESKCKYTSLFFIAAMLAHRLILDTLDQDDYERATGLQATDFRYICSQRMAAVNEGPIMGYRMSQLLSSIFTLRARVSECIIHPEIIQYMELLQYRVSEFMNSPTGSEENDVEIYRSDTGNPDVYGPSLRFIRDMTCVWVPFWKKLQRLNIGICSIEIDEATIKPTATIVDELLSTLTHNSLSIDGAGNDRGDISMWRDDTLNSDRETVKLVHNKAVLTFKITPGKQENAWEDEEEEEISLSCIELTNGLRLDKLVSDNNKQFLQCIVDSFDSGYESAFKTWVLSSLEKMMCNTSSQVVQELFFPLCLYEGEMEIFANDYPDDIKTYHMVLKRNRGVEYKNLTDACNRTMTEMISADINLVEESLCFKLAMIEFITLSFRDQNGEFDFMDYTILEHQIQQRFTDLQRSELPMLIQIFNHFQVYYLGCIIYTNSIRRAFMLWLLIIHHLHKQKISDDVSIFSVFKQIFPSPHNKTVTPSVTSSLSTITAGTGQGNPATSAKKALIKPKLF